MGRLRTGARSRRWPAGQVAVEGRDRRGQDHPGDAQGDGGLEPCHRNDRCATDAAQREGAGEGAREERERAATVRVRALRRDSSRRSGVSDEPATEPARHPARRGGPPWSASGSRRTSASAVRPSPAPMKPAPGHPVPPASPEGTLTRTIPSPSATRRGRCRRRRRPPAGAGRRSPRPSGRRTGG